MKHGFFMIIFSYMDPGTASRCMPLYQGGKLSRLMTYGSFISAPGFLFEMIEEHDHGKLCQQTQYATFGYFFLIVAMMA